MVLILKFKKKMSDVVPAYVSYLPHLLKQTYMYIWGIHVYYINNYYTCIIILTKNLESLKLVIINFWTKELYNLYYNSALLFYSSQHTQS